MYNRNQHMLNPGFEVTNQEFEYELYPEMELAILSEAPAVSRNSREYIKWVQESLNKIMGLRLNADGVAGPLTRSAIRSFQRSKGLTDDGIVGPKTEEALMTASGNTGTSPTMPSPPSNPIPVSANPHIPPTEGPLQGITGYTGRSGKKCWDKAKSADIVDADAPWNNASNRSAANYARVLDYLNVGEESPGNTFNKPSENPRYRQQAHSTYCNIYVHDATRMMWASIPHWIRTTGNRLTEINANDTVEWMLRNGNTIGWALINAPFKTWIAQQNSQRASLPNPGISLSNNLILAAQNVSAGNHSDPSLLNQSSYVAQQFANLGLPTVAIWKNSGGIGHVTMIRPESPGKTGKLVNGIFIPRTAQAGAKNFSNDYSVFRSSSIGSGAVLFFVHE
jgi:peptidoglycan hydrolase-like protein with peptidoglycan-binding domain